MTLITDTCKPTVLADPLQDMLRPERFTEVVDIGANPIDGPPPYKSMLDKGLCRLTGFEPQAEAFAQLARNQGAHERYLPYAVGAGGERTLHVCRGSGMSSLLKPHRDQLALFPEFARLGHVERKMRVSTVRLDDIQEIVAIDLLKIDAQGSELDVFTSGQNALSQAVAIQTEVSFVPLYHRQPAFGAVDTALRELGFIPHCFVALKPWPLAHEIRERHAFDDPRQLLEGDLLYVRDFSRPENMSAEQWKHLAMIAHHCYASSDLALRAVSMAARLGAIPSDAPARYAQMTESVRQGRAIRQGTTTDDAASLYNHANALKRAGHLEAALTNYDRAIAINPGFTEAHSNRGNALMALKRPADGLASFETALALEPDFAEALSNRGNALLALRRFDDALASYESAMELRPDSPEIHLNCAVALLALERPAEALRSCDRTLALKPTFAQAQFLRGAALKELHRFAEAIESYGTALALQPDHKYAMAAAAECAAKSCDWRWRQNHEETLRQSLIEQSAIVPPFLVLSHFDDPDLQLGCARSFLKDQIGSPVSRPSPLPTGRREKIRLAYLSADFRRHATAYLIADLIERHDRERFDVIGLSVGPDDASDMRARLAGAFGRFIDLATTTDEEAARAIEDLDIDILIDLMGHTQFARSGVLALRPAPIQAHYLAFPGTTGADFIDYIIADPVVAPFDRQVHYSERIVHLPHCYQANSERCLAPQAPSRDPLGLPTGGFVFCCFNAVWKITPAMFDIWMRLLKGTPDSVLWLMGDNAQAKQNLRIEAKARGVDPARLVFAERAAPDEHLSRYACADLFLDTAPYNAHTTASDALWSGLPLVTCPGATFAARVAASLLNAIGLPELITSSFEEYEALAQRLANDATLLSRIRTKLEAHRQTRPLFDGEGFRVHIERAYETMWRIWRRGESPRSFRVEPAALEPTV